MKTITLFFTLLGLLCLVSCGNADGPQIEMSYGETQCSDAWGTGSGSTFAEVQSALREYLDDKGIKVTDVEVVDNGPIITCAACDCSSNRVISLQVSEDDQTEMETEGFVKS